MRATRPLMCRGGYRHRGMPVVLMSCLMLVLSISCEKPTRVPSEPKTPIEVEMPPYLADTIGEFAKVAGREVVRVQGYGFVTGLDGTGSKVLPPGIRRQVLDMMMRHNVAHPEEVLGSPDNAVVMVFGVLTPGMSTNERFDLDVRTIPTTDTTSLEGGFLLDCDLVRVTSSRSGDIKGEPLAIGRGAIFVPPSSAPDDRVKGAGDPRFGRVLAGGRALQTNRFRLSINDPSVRTADQLVRLINTRFPGAAEGTTDPSRVNLSVPKDYLDDKIHFLDLVGATFLHEMPAARDVRLKLLADAIQKAEDLDRVTLCMESFGAAALPHLRQLADSPNPMVRLYVGRTLAYLQEPLSVVVLEPLALDDKSPLQEMAVEALGRLHGPLAQGVLGRCLDAKSARVRVAAWQAMARITPRLFLVQRYLDRFKLSIVATSADPFVYVTSSMEPEIVIFGNVKILPPVLAETRRVTATLLEGQKEVTIFKKLHGQDYRLSAPPALLGFIKKMAAPMDLENNPGTPQGLELDYSDIVGLLIQMNQRKALSGPLVFEPLQYKVPGGEPTLRPIGEPEGPEIILPPTPEGSDAGARPGAKN